MKTLRSALRSIEIVETVPDEEVTAVACQDCGDRGFLFPDHPVGHPDFGKARPCSCTEERRKEKLYRSLVERSRLGELRFMTFGTFERKGKGKPESPERAFAIAAKYSRGELATPWLLFWGSWGTGKTHLAAAVANSAIDHESEAVVFVVVPEFLDHLRATYAPSSDVTFDGLFAAVKEVPLLIMDDYGVGSEDQERMKPWERDKLFQIINHRSNNRLRTVLTTNLNPSQIEGRLRSRILEQGLCTTVRIKSGDARTEGSWE